MPKPTGAAAAKRLIIYELDGTLVDSLEDLVAAVNVMLGEMGASPLSAREIRRHVGWGLHELVRRCLCTDEARRIERGMTRFRAYYGRHLLDHTQLYPGARDVLDHFRARRQGIVTNKPNPFCRDVLEGLGVSGYFSEVIAGDSGHPKKPDPAGVRALLKSARVDPSESLLVGDSPIDVETGRRARVFTIGVLNGFADEQELQAAAPDAVAHDLGELLAMAKARGW